MKCVANSLKFIATTLTHVLTNKKCAVMNLMDFNGVNTLTNVNYTAVNIITNGAISYRNAFLMMKNAAHMTLLTANGLMIAVNTVANTIKINMTFGVQQRKLALMNVTVAQVIRQPANVNQENSTLTLNATLKKNVAINTGAKSMDTDHV